MVRIRSFCAAVTQHTEALVQARPSLLSISGRTERAHARTHTSIRFTLASMPKKEVTIGPVCGSALPSASSWSDFGLKLALRRTRAPFRGTATRRYTPSEAKSPM